jgi:hypothetical protein
MLPANLTTNEVKNAAGTEEEFLGLSTEGRKRIFAKSGETPNLPHRITVSHQETGTGVALRRRSLVRIDKTIAGASTDPRVVSAYVVCDIPVGDLAALTEPKAVLANLMSLVASLGASTTILYDCTGYGADALINGSL